MTEPPPRDSIHATCVAIDGRGVLITGPSGSGKSDLALRLIDRGAQLISDDRTIVEADRNARLIATAPARLAGQIEVRGLGIIRQPCSEKTPVALAVALVPEPPRMPDANLHITIKGILLPLIHINAKESSAPIKVEIALQALAR